MGFLEHNLELKIMRSYRSTSFKCFVPKGTSSARRMLHDNIVKYFKGTSDSRAGYKQCWWKPCERHINLFQKCLQGGVGNTLPLQLHYRHLSYS